MTGPDLMAALATIGWSGRELSLRLGCHRSQVGDWAHGRQQVPASVAAWLAGLSDHYRQHPAPEWRTQSAA